MAVGPLIYDVSRKQNFQMKTTLVWSINDFYIYGMTSRMLLTIKLIPSLKKYGLFRGSCQVVINTETT
jgi:hypothetical protein